MFDELFKSPLIISPCKTIPNGHPAATICRRRLDQVLPNSFCLVCLYICQPFLQYSGLKCGPRVLKYARLSYKGQTTPYEGRTSVCLARGSDDMIDIYVRYEKVWPMTYRCRRCCQCKNKPLRLHGYIIGHGH